jgi:hypothetical protein
MWHLFVQNMAKTKQCFQESEATILHFSFERQIKIEFSTSPRLFMAFSQILLKYGKIVWRHGNMAFELP